MKRILCMDDEDGILQLYTRILMGYDLITVGKPEEGESAMRDVDLDLIISDNSMGSSTKGIDVLTNLRCSIYGERNKSVRFILATSDDEVGDEAENYGGSYLPKPFRAAELNELVKRVLEE